MKIERIKKSFTAHGVEFVILDSGVIRCWHRNTPHHPVHFKNLNQAYNYLKSIGMLKAYGS